MAEFYTTSDIKKLIKQNQIIPFKTTFFQTRPSRKNKRFDFCDVLDETILEEEFVIERMCENFIGGTLSDYLFILDNFDSKYSDMKLTFFFGNSKFSKYVKYIKFKNLYPTKEIAMKILENYLIDDLCKLIIFDFY